MGGDGFENGRDQIFGVDRTKQEQEVEKGK
jgi:hypothetical protein